MDIPDPLTVKNHQRQSRMNNSYQWIFHHSFKEKVKRWQRKLRSGDLDLGRNLRKVIGDRHAKDISHSQLIDALIITREPTKYAESEVRGDGSDWTQNELALLGDMTVACQVDVYDDGKHVYPQIHEKPFKGLLLFMSGALFRNDAGQTTPDYEECVENGKLNSEAFQALIVRRLRPLLKYANKTAKEQGRKTVMTIPGVGCGQFAGSVGADNDIPGELDKAIRQVLKDNGERLTHIACVRFDPYIGLEDAEDSIHGISYRVRPYLRSMFQRPQLSDVRRLEEQKGELEGCLLSSVVAWDPVSWPGNDFYIGNRTTDDGVKAAASSLMTAMTGIEGEYRASDHGYYPSDDKKDCWEQLIRRQNLRLNSKGNVLYEKTKRQ